MIRKILIGSALRGATGNVVNRGESWPFKGHGFILNAGLDNLCLILYIDGLGAKRLRYRQLESKLSV